MDGRSSVQSAKQPAQDAAPKRKVSASSNQQVKLKGKGMRDSVIEGETIHTGYLEKKSGSFFAKFEKR
jgi:hypothetical protein